MEAVASLDEEKRWIKVAIYQKTRYLVIRVENPCAERYLNQKKGPDRGYGSQDFERDRRDLWGKCLAERKSEKRR